MNSVEFLIIYVGLVLFSGICVLYMAVYRINKLSVCNAEATVKLSDALYELANTMESYRKGSLEIVSAINKMNNKQDNEFEWIKKELLKRSNDNEM